MHRLFLLDRSIFLALSWFNSMLSYFYLYIKIILIDLSHFQLLFVFCSSCLFTLVQKRNMLRRYWTSWTHRGSCFGMSAEDLLPLAFHKLCLTTETCTVSGLSVFVCSWPSCDQQTELGWSLWCCCRVGRVVQHCLMSKGIIQRFDSHSAAIVVT